MNKNWETWDQQTIHDFQKRFLDWYDLEKRNLPWRFNTDPYRIWISEIMLQQTRVDTVIDYFYRFMETFPTIQALAEAPEDQLLKVWEGLGYYSRARNIQTAAQQVLHQFGGIFPNNLTDIRSLKGIGPYTAGAIGSIAFNLPEPAIDGNVMRVVSRLFEINEDIAKPASRKTFEAAMKTIISHDQPGNFNQALMDLGSSICTPTSPKCESCPLINYCLAYKNHRQTDFPVKSKKQKPKDLYFVAGAIENQAGAFLLKQQASTGLLASMWLFPMEEISQARFTELKESYRETFDLFSSQLIAEETPEFLTQYEVVWQKKILGEVKHVFTHLRWHILVFYGRGSDKISGTWVQPKNFPQYVFPKPQQKMLAVVKKEQERKH